MKDSASYKKILETELEEVTKELSSIGIHNPKNPSDWVAVPRDLDAEEPDLNLAADAVEEWNERSALVATIEARYNGICAALERIEKGTFGVCEICKKPIEEKRLLVSPSARTCMEHKEEEGSLP